MSRSKRIIAADCETDPFRHKRDPEPFIWGTYDGTTFRTFATTKDFVDFIATQSVIVYAHNGGKFDFMFLLSFLLKYKSDGVRAQIINGRIVKMKLGKAELRDSFAAIPIGLGVVGKKEIDYAKLEKEVRHLHVEEIREYLMQDCVSLYELMNNYREIAGKQPTIASNALKYCKKLGIDPGKTNNHFDAVMRDFYFGGRTECFRPGTHKNFHVLDIHSAYPFAMTHDHPSGDENIRIEISEFNRLKQVEKQRCFLRIKCNVKSGCFPKRTKTGLDFPVGVNEFNVTGWEYVAALDLNLISDVEIREIIRFNETINFTDYIAHWYSYKDAHSEKNSDGQRLHPIQYEIGKRMQNALYGKLSQDPARYYDYKIFPGGTVIDREQGWELADEYQDVEIHCRPALWKYEQEFGSDWRGRPLYNNVATGASITGFTRAHLLRAIHAVGYRHVIYCDTDSLMFDEKSNYRVLPMSNKLGDWEYEQKGDLGHFAGKKLYGIRTAGKKDKIASKGGKLTFDKIKSLIDGEIILWQNDAPSFSIAGKASYVSRRFRQTANKPLENQP